MTRIAGECGGINGDDMGDVSVCKEQGVGVTCTVAVLRVNDTTIMAYVNGHYSTTYTRPMKGSTSSLPYFITLFANPGSTFLFKDLTEWVVT